jgi:hypothetical protein
MDHEISNLIKGCRLAIDDHQLRSVLLGESWKSRSGIDNQGRAGDQEEIAGCGKLLRPAHGPLGHGLAERDGGRFEDPAAGDACRRIAAGLEMTSHPIEFMTAAAGEAPGIGAVAMQLDNLIFGKAGCLMQAIDILGNHRWHASGGNESREAEVTLARASPAIEIVHHELAPPCLPARFRALNEQIKGNRLVVHPWTIRGSEVRDAAFGRDPRAGKSGNDPGVLNHFLKCGD